ncbi:hypothetical protein PIB30_105809, partial [Stylosanthes scabra]|nr:hypothetical protein [Stylosanthes scabra]
LDVTPMSWQCVGTYISLWCVRIGTGFGLQAFLCDLLVPGTLFSHFRSDLSLLNPKTLEQTNQGIKRNGKHFDAPKSFRKSGRPPASAPDHIK